MPHTTQPSAAASCFIAENGHKWSSAPYSNTPNLLFCIGDHCWSLILNSFLIFSTVKSSRADIIIKQLTDISETNLSSSSSYDIRMQMMEPTWYGCWLNKTSLNSVTVKAWSHIFYTNLLNHSWRGNLVLISLHITCITNAVTDFMTQS